MNTSKVTRFEVIDHTPCVFCKGTTRLMNGEMCHKCNGAGFSGREVVFFDKDKQVDLELQDNDKTLKIFIHERYE